MSAAHTPRFVVIPTPRGMWPFKVWDTVRNTDKASVNSREDAERIAAKYNIASAKAKGETA